MNLEYYRFLQQQLDILTLAVHELGSINPQLKQQAEYAKQRIKERQDEKNAKVPAASGI